MLEPVNYVFTSELCLVMARRTEVCRTDNCLLKNQSCVTLSIRILATIKPTKTFAVNRHCSRIIKVLWELSSFSNRLDMPPPLPADGAMAVLALNTKSSIKTSSSTLGLYSPQKFQSLRERMKNQSLRKTDGRKDRDSAGRCRLDRKNSMSSDRAKLFSSRTSSFELLERADQARGGSTRGMESMSSNYRNILEDNIKDNPKDDVGLMFKEPKKTLSEPNYLTIPKNKYRYWTDGPQRTTSSSPVTRTVSLNDPGEKTLSKSASAPVITCPISGDSPFLKNMGKPGWIGFLFQIPVSVFTTHYGYDIFLDYDEGEILRAVKDNIGRRCGCRLEFSKLND